MSAIATQLTQVAPPRIEPKKGRFAVNLGSNLANFALGILVGLWLTPYLIRHLGVAAYGLVPLAVTVTSYMGLFTTALNAAVGRFITLCLDRRDYAEANRIFNTSFWGTVAVLAVLLGPALWLSSQARFFFNVPAGYEHQFVSIHIVHGVSSGLREGEFRFDRRHATSSCRSALAPPPDCAAAPILTHR